MPCYYCSDDRVIALASDLKSLIDSGILAPQVCWDALREHLTFIGLGSQATCLKGVSELPRGYRMRLTNIGSDLDRLWSPWCCAGQSLQVPPREIPEALFQTVNRCIATQAAQFNRISCAVSGGVDSSIVAAALSLQDTPFDCVTLFDDDPSGDERQFSRALGAHLNLKVAERCYPSERYELTGCVAPYLPRPIGNPNAQLWNAVIHDHAQASSADAVFHGGGGDALFCLLRSIGPLFDRLIAEGPTWRVLQTLDDLCRFTGASYVQAIRKLIARASAPRLTNWPRENSFLASVIEDDRLSSCLQPERTDRASKLPGKTSHVRAVLMTHNFLEGDRAGDAAEIMSPLICQPVLELCLQIPTWLWYRGARDRSIARDAFANILPAVITNRKSKGTPGGVESVLYFRHRDRIRAHLAEGLLAQNGVIDANAIIAALDDQSARSGEKALRILMLADAESWARLWSERCVTPSPRASGVGTSGLVSPSAPARILG